jgi:predicted HAD superfamily Cof-like phosphohydrolase
MMEKLGPYKPESKLRSQVRAFHEAFSVPVLTRPQVPSDERVRLRLRLIAEEFFELLEACVDLKHRATAGRFGELDHWLDAVVKESALKVNLPELADALGDLDYVIEGTRLEFGINGEPIADEIQRSNMAKVGGPVLPGGKIGKPDGWTAPDIAGELRKQGWEG